MAVELVLSDDVKNLDNFIFLGQRELRRAFVEFIRALFRDLKFTEEFRYSDEKTVTLIHISSEFPEDAKRYPRIIVESTPMASTQISFKDVSSRNDVTGDLYFSGQHAYAVSIKIRDYKPDPVEKISDKLVFLFAIDTVRNSFAVNYKVYIDPTKGFVPTPLIAIPIQGTDTVGFESSIRMFVIAQWEVRLPGPDVPLIASEKVVSEKQDC